MKHLAALAFALAATVLPFQAAAADPYPAKPIRLVVPYPPGGGVDAVGRLLARKLSERLQQQVIVDNRPGAATIIGTETVARAPADGYTLGIVTDSHAINAAFGRKLPYHELRDFTPITQLLNVPLVLLAHPSVPAGHAAELIAHAKANPGRLTFASLGPASPHELAMEWFRKLAGADIHIVGYKGVAPALSDLLGGHVQLMYAGSAVADAHVKAGRLKALGTTGTPPAGSPIPAIERALPGYTLTTWYALVGPARLPPDVAARLHGAVTAVLAQPDVREQLAGLGAEPVGGTPEQLQALVRAEVRKWGDIIRATNARAD
jgi:tripartite-type tricarboxylate transporter receptor subunit TctC